MQPPKALDTIGNALKYQQHAASMRYVLPDGSGLSSWCTWCAGKNLQAQYERWQPRAKYKMHLDPTMDDVKKLAVSSRRAAKVVYVL